MDKKIRSKISLWLQSEGYIVKDVSSGSGVPAQSRLELTKDGKTESCCVRFSKKSGRIGFNRKENGKWDVLSDSALVAYGYANPESNAEILEVQLYRGSDIEEAFDSTHTALKQEDKDGYQVWLAPFKEKGTRFLGSGFRSKSLIDTEIRLEETVEVELPEAVIETSRTQTKAEAPYEQAKTILAKSLGVDPSCVEIEVRVRE